MAKESEIRKKATQKLDKEKFIYWYPAKVRFKQNDIFGIFDIICFRKKIGKLKFIQLTTLSNLSTRRRKINSFLKKNKINSSFRAKIEIWAWNNRNQTFKIEKI